MQTEYQELLEEVQDKMRDLGEKPELLGQVIRETLDRHSDELIDLAVQETLHWTTSELYGCTLEQVAFDVLDYELGQDYLREQENERYTVWDDTFGFEMTDNDGDVLAFDSRAEAEQQIFHWFSEQNQTQVFLVLDKDGDAVRTLTRPEENQ